MNQKTQRTTDFLSCLGNGRDIYQLEAENDRIDEDLNSQKPSEAVPGGCLFKKWHQSKIGDSRTDLKRTYCDNKNNSFYPHNKRGRNLLPEALCRPEFCPFLQKPLNTPKMVVVDKKGKNETFK